MFFPTIEVYRMPYPDLVNRIRDALRLVYTKAFAMEQGWLKAEGRRLNVKNTSSSSPSKPGRTSSAPTVPRKSLKTENAEVKKPDKSSPMEAWLRSIGLLVRSKNSNKGTQNEETWLEAEEKKLNIKYTPNSLNAGPNSRESVAALKNPQS